MKTTTQSTSLERKIIKRFLGKILADKRVSAEIIGLVFDLNIKTVNKDNFNPIRKDWFTNV